jgi:hypothetical protein
MSNDAALSGGANLGPIFIHSMFRTGSTWLFDIFRRAGGGASYFCYQEPFHESLLALNDNPAALLGDPVLTNHLLRHPSLDKPYFWEFHEISESLRGLFRPSFTTSAFFSENDEHIAEDQALYIDALLNHAKARPVLQFCRSSGRMRAMRKQFNGLHIHLWREPRSQWWSYKVTDYFDLVTQKIYASAWIPDVLIALRGQWGIDGATPKCLPPRVNYAAFYGLWLYSWMQAHHRMQIDVCIDQLAMDSSYHAKVVGELKGHCVPDVSLKGCKISTISLTDSELDFYVEIEESVHQLFLQHKYDLGEINEATRIIENINSLNDKTSARTSAPVRATALRLMEDLARMSDRHRRFSDAVLNALQSESGSA